MKKNKLKGLIVLGAFSLVMGTALSVSLGAEEKYRVAKAETTKAPGINVYLKDWSGVKLTSNGYDACLHLYNITYHEQSGFSTSSDIISASYKIGQVVPWNYSKDTDLYIKMNWAGGNREYSVLLPWFIKSCTFNIFKQDGTDRYATVQGNTQSYSNTLQQSHDYTITIENDGNYGSWWDGNTYRAGKISFDDNSTANRQYDETTYTVTINSNGGTSLDPQSVWFGGKVVNYPTKAGCTFWKFTKTNSSSAEDVTNTPIRGNTALYAQWKSLTNSTFRLWIWRSVHYATDQYEWKIWDGVGGSNPYTATGYAQMHYGSSIYLVYFDLPTNINNVIPQVFNKSGGYQVGGSGINYQPGDNAYLWYPTGVSGGNLYMNTHGLLFDTGDTADQALLTLVLSAYFTCENNANNGYGNAAQLYKTWIYDNEAGHTRSNIYGANGEAGAIAAASSYGLYDYTFSGSTHDYTNDQNRTYSTTIYSKVTSMMNMQTKGRVSNAYINPAINGTSSEGSAIIISTIVAIIGIGGFFFLRKKRA